MISDVRLQPDDAKNIEEREQGSDWRAGFEAQALDPESMDLSFAAHAQAEVVLGKQPVEI